MTSPLMPAAQNISITFCATPGCLMLQYKDATIHFNIASKGTIAPWSSTLILIFCLATLLPHSRHRPRHEYLTQHKFASRLAQLQEAWDPELAEQLDRDFQQASSSAAKSVRHKPYAPFVTKFANLCQGKNVLKQIISQHCTGIDLSLSIVHQVCNSHNFLVPETITECKQRCHAAQKEIRQLEKDSVTLRGEEQTRLHCEAIQRGDNETAKAIKYRLAAERTKQTYQKLWYIHGIQKTGISCLEVPQDSTRFNYKQCTEWITIDTPQGFESKLRDRNQHHFGQAHGTFLTVPPSLNGSTGVLPPTSQKLFSKPPFTNSKSTPSPASFYST